MSTPHTFPPEQPARSGPEHVLTGNQAQGVGYGACTQCDCSDFISSGGSSTECGRAGCGHGYQDHQRPTPPSPP